MFVLRLPRARFTVRKHGPVRLASSTDARRQTASKRFNAVDVNEGATCALLPTSSCRSSFLDLIVAPVLYAQSCQDSCGIIVHQLGLTLVARSRNRESMPGSLSRVTSHPPCYPNREPQRRSNSHCSLEPSPKSCVHMRSLDTDCK